MVVSCLKNALLWGQKISKTSFVLGERTRFRHESENPNWSIIIWVLAPSMSEHIKGQIGSFYTEHKFTIILVVTVTGVGTHTQDISRYDPSTNCFTSDALAAGNQCLESWKSLEPIGRTPTVEEIVPTWRYHSLRKISGIDRCKCIPYWIRRDFRFCQLDSWSWC